MVGAERLFVPRSPTGPCSVSLLLPQITSSCICLVLGREKVPVITGWEFSLVPLVVQIEERVYVQGFMKENRTFWNIEGSKSTEELKE